MTRSIAAALLLTTGCIAMQKDVAAQSAQIAEDRKVMTAQQQQIVKLQADVVATQQRLDNALRANADTGVDLVSEKQRLNALAGRIDEVDHGLGDVKRDVGTSRAEVDQRLDELKRAIDAQANKPPPVAIPPDKAAHFASIEAARTGKDSNLERTLGREYVNRYPADDKTDDVLFYLGDAELADNHPAAALGDFNRVLKSHPKSNVLAETLFGMGQAYLALHDCENAKLAFQACEMRFAKDKMGQESHAKLAVIAKPPAGLCAPPP